MPEKTLTTPVLFIVFNRPDVTALVFEEIRKARPTRLFVTGDGPRPNRPEDAELCRQTRAIATAVDWPCEIKTLFRDKNLGCKYAVGGAFDWFFSEVEEGIILEDDDIPDPSFFPFCAEMLERYRNNPEVMHISGHSYQEKNKDFVCNESYYFSTIPHIWGWATWRRAWKLYDIELTTWPKVRDTKELCKIFNDGAKAFRWGHLFQQYYDKQINSYDGQWAYACFLNRGLSIGPKVNLISNIGFGPGATHGTDPNFEFANLSRYPLQFPLVHPKTMKVNTQADEFTHKYVHGINRYWSQKVKWFFKSHMPGPYIGLKEICYRVTSKKNPIRDERKLMC